MRMSSFSWENWVGVGSSVATGETVTLLEAADRTAGGLPVRRTNRRECRHLEAMLHRWGAGKEEEEEDILVVVEGGKVKWVGNQENV